MLLYARALIRARTYGGDGDASTYYRYFVKILFTNNTYERKEGRLKFTSFSSVVSRIISALCILIRVIGASYLYILVYRTLYFLGKLFEGFSLLFFSCE